jgi:hypothetical protein
MTPYWGLAYPGDHSVAVKNSTIEISENNLGSGCSRARTMAVVTATEITAVMNRKVMITFSP